MQGTSDDGPAQADLLQALALARDARSGLPGGPEPDRAGHAGRRPRWPASGRCTRPEALTAAVALGRHPSAWSAGATGLLAHTDLLRGDPVGAAARSAEALGTGETFSRRRATPCTPSTGPRSPTGERGPGLERCATARTGFGQNPAPAPLLVSLAVLEHRVALLNGNLAAAVEVEAWLLDRVGDAGEIRLLSAWAQAAMGHHEPARDLVAPLHEPAIRN